VTDSAGRQQGDAQQEIKRRSRLAEYIGSADFWTALATIFLVVVGVWGVIETKGALEATQRAWLTPISAQVTRQLVVDQGIRFGITFINPGREPATDVVLKFRNDTIESYNPLYTDMNDIPVPENKTCDGLKPVSGRSIISPTGPNVVGVAWALDSRHGEPQFLVNDRILKGDRFYVVTGCAAYVTYYKPRKTSFCYVLERVVSIQTMGPPNVAADIAPPQNMATGNIGDLKLPGYRAPGGIYTFNFATCARGFAAD
jgi:hypothetical protein